MNEPLSIDLNIDRMRARVYQEMAQACRPFYERLAQLDTVEAFLKAEQSLLNRQEGQARSWETRQTRKKAKIIQRQHKQLSSGNTTGAYALMTQKQAIVDAVHKEPGMDCPTVTQRLVDGGYPFKGNKPLDAMYVGMRGAVHAGLIRQESNPGQKISYYPMDGAKPTKPKAKAPYNRGLNDAVVQAIANSPESGITRDEVLTAVTGSGFQIISPNPARSIGWALQSLLDGQRIGRVGHGPGSRFTRPKITATKK